MISAIVFGLVAGIILSLFLPTLLARTRLASWAGNAWFAFAAKAMKRPAVSVGNRGSPSLRQLSFDSTYEQETVEVGEVEKKITRTAGAVHRVGATPFAFFDERFGVIFDLRDLLVGRLEHELREDGEIVKTHTEFGEDGEPTLTEHYWRGFLEIEERPGLDLDVESSVRPITDGSEEADWWSHVYEAVRRMYILRQEEVSVLKMIIPFAVGGAALFVGYYVFGPGPMPGTGGGTSAPDAVSVGWLILTGAGGGALGKARRILAAVKEQMPWVAIAKTIGLTAAIALAGLLSVAAGPFNAVLFWGSLLIGFGILPLITLIMGAAGYGGPLAELFLWGGIQAFDEPILNLTSDDRYRFVEADALGLEDHPRVRIAKSWIGLSCDVNPDAFGRAGYAASDVADYQPPKEFTPDGGSSVIPRGYTPAEGMRKAGKDAFVPRSLSPDTTYVRLDAWLRRFKDAATGHGVDTADREATKDFAAGDPKWSDEKIMSMSVKAAIAGLGFWGVVALVF
jgi:hypothetical protein